MNTLLFLSGKSGGTSPAPTPPGGGQVTLPYGVNVGGPQYTAGDATVFQADPGATSQSSGGVSVWSAGVAGTTDDTLFQSERYGVFTYDVNTGNGTFDVTLYLCENYQQVAGGRENTITVEGSAGVTDLDLFATVGFRTAYQTTVRVTVAGDGLLTIAATDAGPADTLLNAFKITAVTGSAPAAISDLAAVAGNTQATVTWTVPVGASSVSVWRSTTTPVSTAGAATFVGATTPLVDTGRTNGVQLYYAAKASNASGTSAVSNEATATPAAPTGYVIYVRTTGNDTTGDGTTDNAYATVPKAWNAVRVLTSRTVTGGEPPVGWQGARIILGDGTYYLTAMLSLNDQDRGTVTYPVFLEAENAGQAIVSGAKLIADNQWAQVTGGSDSFANGRLASPSATYFVNLAAHGVTTAAMNGGYGVPFSTPMPIDDGAIVPLSRYPAGAETDSSAWLPFTASTDAGSGLQATIDVVDNTINSWNTTTEQNIMLYGCWAKTWAIYWERMTTIATVSGSTRRLTIPNRTGAYRINDFANDPNNRFVAMRNVLEGTSAGTYTYCPSQTGNLYYRNSGGTAPTAVSITNLSTLFTLGSNGLPARGANWITFKNLILEGWRSSGIIAYDCDGVVLDGCTLRNYGGDGFYFKNAYLSGLTGCTIQDGGFRQGLLHARGKSTLTDSGCFVTNLTATRVGFLAHSQSTSYLATFDENENGGCGVAITGGTWSALPGPAIWPRGALSVVSGGTFTNCVQLVGDAGAIYAGRCHSNVGKQVKDCAFSNITRHVRHSASQGAVFGTYMDDAESFCTIQDNTYNTCDHAIYHASGKDIIMRRNKFTTCDNGHHTAPIFLGSRLGNEASMGVEIQQELDNWPLGTAPWSTTYPWLKNELANGAHPSDGSTSDGTGAGNILGPKRSSPSTVYPVIVDNMNTTGSYIARLVSAVSSQHDTTQLNYPVGASGTPAPGGGSVPLSTMIHS